MSNWHTDQLKYALGLGGLMSFYGVVSLVVWFASEHLKRPVSERIVIIALVLLTLPIALVIGWLATRRKKKSEHPEAAAQIAAAETPAAATQKPATPTGNYDELTQSAEEAVQFLKSSNVGAGKDAVYALPWYLVAGAPKSGKTSLSLASGFDFQNLPSQRQSEQKIIRPTRNVDWRVTNDAVFLDTAGRYQTEGVDGDEWSAILETLKKYRGARPLDGMILSVNTERILQAENAEIEQIAKVLRSRIDEAMLRTKVRFPIYLVFTHADAIEGFRDSFSVSQREGENLVWGATVPLEKSPQAHSLFDSEFDLLHSSIMKRRLMRLSAPFPPVRQLKIFNFPIHFGAARKKLGAFVSTLFRPNPFNENPFLRGFYFTAVPVNRSQPRGGQTMTNAAQTVGQTYFAEKLFRDVILRDKDLVKTFQAQQVKPPILGWLLTALGAISVLAFLGFSAFSLYQNKKLVDEAAARGEEVLVMTRAGKDRNHLTKTPEETGEEIDKIEKLRQSLVTLDKYEREGAPFWMRFGLYSGNSIYLQNLLPIYISAVEQRFAKPSVLKLEDDLKKFAASKPVANPAQLSAQEEELLGKNYDLLKTYLMLSGVPEYRSRAESASIETALADYWKTESKIPAGAEQVSLENLKFWAKQIDRKDKDGNYYIVTSYGTNEKTTVEGVRKNLQAFPAVFKYYKRVTDEVSKKIEAVGTDSILAGRRAGILEGSYPVRGAYTIDGYRNYIKEAIANAQSELTKDDWVMGENAGNGQTQNIDIQRLQDKYFNDYTDNWRKFVRGISIKPYKNSGEAVDSFKALSSAESPIKIVLEEISRQTNLSAEPESSGLIDWLLSFFKQKQNVETGTLTNVEKEFRPLFAFTSPGADKNAASPLSQYGNELKKLADDLERRTPEQIRQINDQVAAQDGSFVKLLGNVETGINSKTGDLAKTSGGQEIADLLKKPLNNLKDLFGAGIQTQLEKEWKNEVLPKAKSAEKGFPFEAEGEADLTALTAYLNPQNGRLTEFYNKRLKQYFEESNGQLKIKETSEVKFSEDFVKYLNNAFRLRDALFGKNSAPQFAYEFKLQKAGDGIIEVTIDGQKTDSNGTGSASWKFPAQGGETGASVNFASSNDSASTSGTALPAPSPEQSANSSNANVSSNNSATRPSPPSQKPVQTETGTTAIKFPGNWGLFKFFDAGAPKKQPSGEYLLTYKLGGKIVTATIKGDLFDRTMFTTVHAPENFLTK